MPSFISNLLHRASESEVEAPYEPLSLTAEPVSIVGTTVYALEERRRYFESQVDMLTRDITNKIEQRRQYIMSLRSVTMGLTLLVDDPALTAEQVMIADRDVIINLSEIKLDP